MKKNDIKRLENEVSFLRRENKRLKDRFFTVKELFFEYIMSDVNE